MAAPARAPAPADSAAAAHQRQQAAVSAAAALALAREWKQVDPRDIDGTWTRIAARLVAILTAAQRKAASGADRYLARVLAHAGLEPRPAGTVNPEAFAGTAADGRPLTSLLYAPAAGAKRRIARGEDPQQAAAQETRRLAVIAQTETADAGRMADQAAMTADDQIAGYERFVNLPSCPRCILLAGRLYRYSTGFQRHPGCDCKMLPVTYYQWHTEHPENDPEDLLKRMREQHPAVLRKSLTEGDLKALEAGADPGQVINAHRGMTTAAGPGRRISVTTEGTTRRGQFGGHTAAGRGAGYTGLDTGPRGRVAHYTVRRTRALRLTPAQIFTEASQEGWGREEIIRQLQRFGYLF